MQLVTSLPPIQETREATLKHFDRYIVTQVHYFGRHYPTIAHTSVMDLEIDELVQRVRIKFWQALERRHILYPHAYIKLIIKSEFVDMSRQRKSFLPLPTDEEWSYGEAGELGVRNMPDPADEVEQEMEAFDFLNETIQAVLGLPPRQQLALICSLQDRVDDLVQLVNAFKAYRIDIEGIQWPTEKAEKQLLQASLTPARKTLAKKMKARSTAACLQT